MVQNIASQVAAARRWMMQETLPLWLIAGRDEVRAAFHERLDLEGRPVPATPRRVMVQARQIYVFAHAAELGWIDAGDAAVRAFDSMVACYYRIDGDPGWLFSVHPDGRVADHRRDFYAHSFVLLACAWIFRLTRAADVIRLADETLDLLDRYFAVAAGGYRDSASGDERTLRQNPHMHLFEALLALFQATGAERYLDRADRTRRLLSHFFIPGPDILAEYFDRHWRPLGEAIIWEPGHHCEWVWLLQQFAKATGGPRDPIADALYHRAYRDGIGPSAEIADEMFGDGRVAKASRRAWPLTEAIKANGVYHEAGDPLAAGRASAAIVKLMQDFLKPNGLWDDQLDAGGRCVNDYVPASTLYHLFLGFVEADRVFSHAGGCGSTIGP